MFDHLIWNYLLNHWILSTVGIVLIGGLLVTILLGGLSVIKLIADVLDSLTPLLKGAVNGFVWYIQTFWTGLGQLLHNLAVVAVIAPLVAGVWLYTHHSVTTKCKATVKKIHNEYVLTPRKKVVKKPVQRPTYKLDNYY